MLLCIANIFFSIYKNLDTNTMDKKTWTKHEQKTNGFLVFSGEGIKRNSSKGLTYHSKNKVGSNVQITFKQVKN